MKSAQMHLNVFTTAGGYHQGGWRLPGTEPDRFLELAYYAELARACEAAKLDSLFFADMSAIGVLQVCPFDAFTLIAVLAGMTHHLGLIATASTTLSDPFSLARRFSSLDQLSGGRVGWNIVTSHNPSEMENFGLEHLPAHADRYRRADEFVTVAKELWDSWDEDALVLDKVSGVFADVERTHAIDHVGDYFRVRGPGTQPRSVQGWPVLVQAGSSKDGVAFAARHADVVFTAQQTLEEAQAFRADLRQLAGQQGRDPDTIKVLPGLFPVMGKTAEHAEERLEELSSVVDLCVTMRTLEADFGPNVDLSKYALDERLPVEAFEQTEALQSRTKIFVDMVRRENLTFHELLMRASLAHGHHAVIGGYEQVADEMELWFTTGACDGFNVQPPSLPSDLHAFLENVVPLLQERGVFRTEYEGTTLRDRLGLRRPGLAAQAA